MPLRLEPSAPRSRVKHSTTEPLCSLLSVCISTVVTTKSDSDAIVCLQLLSETFTCTRVSQK